MLNAIPIDSTIKKQSVNQLQSTSTPYLFNEFTRILKNKYGIQLDYQQKMILKCQSQHVIVNALAGSSKTFSLIILVAQKCFSGVNPNEILVLAYTKAAANEIKYRLCHLYPAYNINVSTLHSLCFKVLRLNGFDKHTVISSDNEKNSIFKRLMTHCKVRYNMQPDDVSLLYSYYKNSLSEPSDVNLQYLFNSYDAYKRRKRLIDFDDFLTKAYSLLKSNDKLLNMIKSQLSEIYVDESQDLNAIQYELIKLLCGSNNSLYLIGDKFQSIYSFRGSKPDIFDNFKTDYPNASEFSMTLNYRSSGSVLCVANTILRSMNSRDQLKAVKEVGTPVMFIRLENSINESKWIISRIQESVENGTNKYSDYCVLYRSTTAASAIINDLIDSNIPFKSLSVISTVFDHPAVIGIIEVLRESYLESEETPQNVVREIINNSSIQSVIDTKNVQEKTNEDDQEAINNFIEAASTKKTVYDFINYIDKIQSKSKYNAGDDAVTISTIHSSKGMEFPIVFLVACIENVIPHRNVIEPNLMIDKSFLVIGSLEEEQRLLYVAITRAKDELILSAPKVYNNKTAEISRFLIPFEDQFKSI